MLVAQAAQAVERYTGAPVDRQQIADVTDALSASEQNIALIGMPGSGKTRVGQRLAALLGREHIDADVFFQQRYGIGCADFIEREGEASFREAETACLRQLGSRSNLIISCGGGVVTRPENYKLLHQNSRIVMLDRPLAELSSKGRPISASRRRRAPGSAAHGNLSCMGRHGCGFPVVCRADSARRALASSHNASPQVTKGGFHEGVGHQRA